MQGTFFTLKLDTFGSHRTLRQFMFWNVGYTLKVIVASIAKVGRTKAEKDGHTTTVATLVFQVVCTVFRTHLGPRHITAAPADQFFGVVIITLSSVCVALGFTTVVGFPAFVTDVVSVAFQSETCGIIIESGTYKKKVKLKAKIFFRKKFKYL